MPTKLTTITVNELGLASAAAASAAQAASSATQAAASATAAANYPPRTSQLTNGNFRIWQRATSFSAASNYYAADCWRALMSTSGGTFTVSRQDHTPGDTFGLTHPKHYARIGVSGFTGAAEYGIFEQPIESVLSYAGQTITVIGRARRNSGTGNMVVGATQYFGTGGSPSTALNITGTAVTLSASPTWTTFAVTLAIPSVTSKVLGTNEDSYLSIRFWLTAGSDWNTETGSLGHQTLTVDLDAVQVLVGTHTTAAAASYREPRADDELLRCMRYYETARIILAAVPFGGAGNWGSHLWRVPKFKAPTLTLTPDSGTGGTVAADGTGMFYQNANHSVVAGATVTGAAEL